MEITEAIRNMRLYSIPDFTANQNKCEKCSTVQYCMPLETEMLEGQKQRG
jgi:CRISPR-associated exonuclease Cas4